MKNFIIGYGESLTDSVKIKSGSGPKKHLYTFAEARARLVRDLSDVIKAIELKSKAQCANGEVVIKFVQHPSYLAKSYYPTSLFNKYDLKDVGSKSLHIKPIKWAVEKHPEFGLSSCIFVSGSKAKFEAMLNSIQHDRLPETTQNLIRSIEHISSISPNEKIKYVEPGKKELKLEVVLHASEEDEIIRSSFGRYFETFGGVADWNRAKIVGGLTFLPI
ncbi:hypothetical protein [Shewanella sp. KJ2020]|uniref:hypothetical protein n=1 Tax=Shewanella sp. KJ2020 TaxID=2919172 RepID=UPI0020A6F78F|nr:hypothetical protein [Shewanella sp. KJ2020]MCP3129311.1 hypothetical protein [Shewanella sp. KJ2020]